MPPLRQRLLIRLLWKRIVFFSQFYIKIFLSILKPFSITRLVIYYFIHRYNQLHSWIHQISIKIGMRQVNGWEAPLLHLLFRIFDKQKRHNPLDYCGMELFWHRLSFTWKMQPIIKNYGQKLRKNWKTRGVDCEKKLKIYISHPKKNLSHWGELFSEGHLGPRWTSMMELFCDAFCEFIWFLGTITTILY